MRICILTQPLGANYGGILQAYALQKVLRDMGHDVTTLRFAPEAPWWIPSGFKKKMLTFRRFVSKYIKGNKEIVFCDPVRQTRYSFEGLNRFVEKCIHHLDVKAPLSQGKIPTFDAYIVGSDQVWRPKYSPNLPDFYLGFLADSPAIRIAYAASFGVDIWEADEEVTARIRPLAQRFDAISVREESGIKLCEKYLGVKAVAMPDPTLLLTASDYRALYSSSEETGTYIAAYILDRDEQTLAFTNRFANRLGLPVKNIGVFDWAKSADSPEQWLNSIAKASFVITDSFHGTVFSILFNKEFLSLLNIERGASRFTSLLENLGLQDRMISKETLEQKLPNLQQIDYEKVAEMVNAIRIRGLSFLRDNL